MPTYVLTILIVLFLPLCADAQEAGSIYVVGGAGVNHQDGPTGVSPVTYVTAIEVGGRFEHPLDTGVGIMAGLDVRIGGRHFAAQPSFRVMQTAIDTGAFFDGAPPREISAIYPGGYPGWTLRAGIALRGDF